MPTPLTDADKVLRNDTGIDIATNIASIASALTPSNITDLGDVNLTNPITDGQVIKYSTAAQKWVNGLGNITMECTQAQYDAWKQSGQLQVNTLYVITDAPNLNATAQNLSYDGGVTSVYDKIKNLVLPKSLTLTVASGITSNSSAFQIADQMILVRFECQPTSASNSWVNCFEIDWDTSFSGSNFAVVSDGGTYFSNIQAFYNNNKILVRINSPKAVNYRGELIILTR